MNRKYLIALGILAAMGSCSCGGYATAAPDGPPLEGQGTLECSGEGDTPSYFSANGGKILSEDLPTPGYLNRFHYLTTFGSFGWWGPQKTMVLVAAREDGVLHVRIEGYGELNLTPCSPEVRAFIAAAAPGQEDLLQRVTITPGEILIEERERGNP